MRPSKEAVRGRPLFFRCARLVQPFDLTRYHGLRTRSPHQGNHNDRWQEMNELLREILDVQKAHLMAYQKISDLPLAVQHLAVEQQTQAIAASASRGGLSD